MNRLKLLALASVFATGIAQAAPSCDGFGIAVKNDLDETLLVTTINLDGAGIQPSTIQEIPAHTEQVFTVQNSSEQVAMKGQLVFHTIDWKKVKINFDLANKELMCSHNNISPANGQFKVIDERGVGQVKYTISK